MKKEDIKISIIDRIKLFLFPLFSIPDKPEVREYLNILVKEKQKLEDAKIRNLAIKKEL